MNINTKAYIEKFIKIRNKSGKIVNFKLNSPQEKLYEVIKQQKKEKKPVRIIILKARQMGFSTLTEAIFFKETITKFNRRTGIITHLDTATTNLFNMSKLMLENLPKELKPCIKNSNAKELIFDNNIGTGLKSKIKCMTAGTGGVGRSDTFDNLHLSELAFWQGDVSSTLTGLLQAVPNLPDTMIIIESTANGFEKFKELWDGAVSGKNDFYPLFVAWHELSEYAMPYTGFELTAKEKKLKELYNLTNEQLEWRRWCIRNNCQGDEEQFKQEYPANPFEAFLTTGKSVFDKEKIAHRIEEIKDRKPIKKGYFLYNYQNSKVSNIEWIDDVDGYITIYEEPKEGYPYVIGGDTAGEGSDYFIGQVTDNTNDNQVAILEQELAEDIYAFQMYCLGMYYNQALIGIETNYSTYPVMKLSELNYPNQYVRKESPDKFTGKLTNSYGFETNKKTRPVLFSLLVKHVRDNIEKINDFNTLVEMLTIIKNEKGKPEAQQGYHDDHTLALGINLCISDQQTTEIKKKAKNKKIEWTQDMLDDYYRANLELKKKMEELYGKPR